MKTPEITIALAIPHAPWIAGRPESLRRLRDELGIPAWQSITGGEACNGIHAPVEGPQRLEAYREFTDRAPNHVWSEAMWGWLEEQKVTHALSLQDDVLVAPNFWAALFAILTAQPETVICLESAHEAGPALCANDVRAYTTNDGLIGVGYVVPRRILAEFLRWDRWNDPEHALTEDTKLGLFCAATGLRIWSPVPTIIDHDTDLASSYGNDAHARRRPSVTWKDAARFGGAWEPDDLEAPGFWEGRFKRLDHIAPDGTKIGRQRAYSMSPEPARHLGNFYGQDTTKRLKVFVKNIERSTLDANRADNGAPVLRWLSHTYLSKAKADRRVLIASPARGGVSRYYATELLSYQAIGEAAFLHGSELLDAWVWDEDVVRVRSRFLYRFLDTDATDLLWIDTDNRVGPLCVRAMLASKHPCVFAPYPKRDAIHWERIDMQIEQAWAQGAADATNYLGGGGEDIAAKLRPSEELKKARAFAYDYGFGFLPGASEVALDRTGCVEIAWSAMGCCLMRRPFVERVLSFYEAIAKRPPVEFVELEEMTKSHDGFGWKMIAKRLAYEVEAWRRGWLGLDVVDHEHGLEAEDREMLAVFQLLARESPETGIKRLWGEDQSFCFRARDAGEKLMMYIGPGSPVEHDGTHLYQGPIEALGLSHRRM